MKHAIALLGVVAGILAFSPVAANAQPDSARMEKRHQKMMDELKLNADQKAKLQKLHQQHREAMKPFHETMKGIRDKVKAELLKPQPSKQTLDELAVELGNQHRQMALLRNDHLLQVKAVLTPEQFSKLVDRDWMAPPDMKMRDCPHKGNCPHKGDCPRKGARNGGCRHGDGPGAGPEGW